MAITMGAAYPTSPKRIMIMTSVILLLRLYAPMTQKRRISGNRMT
jgi:hypothetical protein